MTLAVQSLTAMALAVPAVLAPVAAADFDASPTAVGRWVGFSYMMAMFAGLAGGTLVGRYGPARILQVSVLGVVLGLGAGAGASVVLLLVCGALLGAAHGLVNPASSAILAVASPSRIRSMIFSIKQTGVPLGGAIAGILVPGLLLWMSWQTAMLLLALGATVLLALVAPYRRLYDAARKSGRLHIRGFGAPVAEAGRTVRSWSSASCRGVLGDQISFITYLVSYLKLRLGYSLLAAGLVFSAAQLAGVLGRSAVGEPSPTTFSPRARCSPRSAWSWPCAASRWLRLRRRAPGAVLGYVCSTAPRRWDGTAYSSPRSPGSLPRAASLSSPAERSSSPSPACWSDRRVSERSRP
jgi:MFS family permease